MRAYIREMDATMSQQNDGAAPMPTVRGLLAQEEKQQQQQLQHYTHRPTSQYLPYRNPNLNVAELSADEPTRPAASNPQNDNFTVSRRSTAPPTSADYYNSSHFPSSSSRTFKHNSSGLSQTQSSDRNSQSEDEAASSDSNDTLSLISTRDLISQLGDLRIHHHKPSSHLMQSLYGASPVPMNPYQSFNLMSSSVPESAIAGGDNMPLIKSIAASRYVPSSGAAAIANTDTVDPGTGAVAPAVISELSASPPRNANTTTAAASAAAAIPRLAPDNFGHEIPPDATWTRIKRSLISLEVLNRAGVRYEARPDFVAILGVLSRDQIAEFASTLR